MAPYQKTARRFGGFSEASGRAIVRDQNLGSEVGSCDVRCKLKGSRSKWTKSADGIQGLLFFTLEFAEHGGIPLRHSTVQIDLAKSNQEPLPTFLDCAPADPIRGRPIQQQMNKTSQMQPNVSLTVLGNGGTIGGVGSSISTTYNELHHWTFKAGNPSIKNDNRSTKAEFSWTRTWEGDHSGSHLTYTGGVLIHRERDENMVLHVQPRIKPWKLIHRIFHARTGTAKQSDPVGPPVGKDVVVDEFQKTVDGFQEFVRRENNKQFLADSIQNVPETASIMAPDEPSTQDAGDQMDISVDNTGVSIA